VIECSPHEGPAGGTIYENGEYLASNPHWHLDHSSWKASQVLKMIRRNSLTPSTVCEVGCGAGEILRRLQQQLPENVRFYGYEISPQAYDLCRERANDRLVFHLQDHFRHDEAPFDLIMALDVVEHVEDVYGFLRGLRNKAQHKIFHIPLNLSAQSVLRGTPLTMVRRRVGHIHFFIKDTALALLQETGYEIVDWFYTAAAWEKRRSLAWAPVRISCRLLFALSPDLMARALGGHSLLVLAR
jgi:SAM-dependent methyltransferase